MTLLTVADGWTLKCYYSLIPSIVITDKYNNTRTIGKTSDPWMFKFLEAIMEEVSD